MTLNYECPVCTENTIVVVVSRKFDAFHVTELYCENHCALEHDHVLEILNKAITTASELEE